MIRINLLGKCHEEVATSHHNIGVSYHEMKDYASSIKHGNEAHQILLKLFRKDNAKVASTYDGIGLSYHLKQLRIRKKSFKSDLKKIFGKVNHISAWHFLMDATRMLHVRVIICKARIAIWH